MFYPLFLRQTLVRFFCMIMLILMQFDVCGYDWMHWYHHSEQAPVQRTMMEETTVGEAAPSLTEWANPVYRYRSVRSQGLTFLPEILACFFSFIPLTLSPSRLSTDPSPQANSPQYLRFGVLRL